MSTTHDQLDRAAGMQVISREKKKGSTTTSGGQLHEKLQLLRSITSTSSSSIGLTVLEASGTTSHAASNNKASIVAGAAKYIKDLKQKVQLLTQEAVQAASTTNNQYYKPKPKPPMVTVSNIENGFRIHVLSDESCPGLLLFVLGSFEDIGLTVLEARVSCTNNFHLEAIAILMQMEQNGGGRVINAQIVKQVVSNAITNWIDNSTSTDHVNQEDQD